MRKYLLGAFAAACVCGGYSPAPAGSFKGLCSGHAPAPTGSFTDAGLFVGKISPLVTAMLLQFPAGGPELRAAVARLVEADPSLADDVVFAALKANPSQKQAMGEGLADAASYFSKCGDAECRRAESRIRTAMSCADAGTRAGYAVASIPAAVQGIPGFGNAGAQTGNCAGGRAVMSPSRPGC